MHGIEVSQRNGDIAWISLSGEFDVSRLQELRNALKTAIASPVETIVDLSEVTFLDLDSVRELVFHCGLSPDGVVPVNPSWQVVASVEACGLEDWVRFGGNESRPALFSNAS